MLTVSKIFYSSFFWSLEILLYLRIVLNMIKTNRLLIIAGGVWFLLLIVQLPIFSIPYVMKLGGFLAVTLFLLMLLSLKYLVDFLFMVTTKMSGMGDDLKGTWMTMKSGMLTFLFACFLLVILLGVLSVTYY